MSTPPCTTCQPIATCAEGLDRYSLQDDVYPFVLDCPPGFDCGARVPIINNEAVLRLICCDGTEVSVRLPTNYTDAELAAAYQTLYSEAGARLPFCNNPPDPPLVLFPSGPQTAVALCPDGGQFSYTLVSGVYWAFTQELANATAYSRAVFLANQQKVCLSALPSEWCEGSVVNFTVTATGIDLGHGLLWDVVSGSLPTGMTLANGIIAGSSTTISGTPTALGSFTFTIMARVADGRIARHTYTMCIIGIVQGTALPSATQGLAYSTTLTSASCAKAPLSWQVTMGTLPAGLSLNETTGVISGTPTGAGTSTFTITLQTEAT